MFSRLSLLCGAVFCLVVVLVGAVCRADDRAPDRATLRFRPW